jgi:hypothetical protein
MIRPSAVHDVFYAFDCFVECALRSRIFDYEPCQWINGCGGRKMRRHTSDTPIIRVCLLPVFYFGSRTGGCADGVSCVYKLTCNLCSYEPGDSATQQNISYANSKDTRD